MRETANGGILLPGLDGGNLLAFLASVGALRTLAVAEPCANWRMKWVVQDGARIPYLSCREALSADMVAQKLFVALRREPAPEFEFAKNLTVTPREFRQVARDAQEHASRHDRSFADFVAAFGCELFQKHGKIQDTGLRTMSGVGHQHFLETMKKLLAKTEAEDLRRSLFHPWDYADRRLGLRWDPEEDRRHALRWENPSDGKGVPTMRGANRLAVEAIPLLPTAVDGRRLRTTGIARRNSAVFITWPIWEDSLNVDVVRSLLALPELQNVHPDRVALRARGIVDIYRCQRITNRRRRNFTHAVSA